MQRQRALVKLNDLNHLRGQSTEISSVGFSDPENNSVHTDFWYLVQINKLFHFKQDILIIYQKSVCTEVLVGSENPTDEISVRCPPRWLRSFNLTKALFRHMCRETLVLGADYFYHPSTYRHQILIFGFVLKRAFRKYTVYTFTFFLPIVFETQLFE